MLIQGALMHVKESVRADDFLRFLADEAPAGHYFVAQPPPGISMTAAIGWRVIVADSAAADALATALWSGYDTMVRPLQNGEQDRRPAVFVQIKNHKGEYDQFTMGKDFDKKEGFLHRMRETVAVLSLKDREAALEQEMESTGGSDYWFKIA